ncbi:hypothetical protein YPPY53_3283, partial [Yersinia pestis PY-53]
MYIA